MQSAGELSVSDSGNAAHPRFTVPVKPFSGVIVSVVPLPASAPAFTLRLLTLESTNAGAVVTVTGTLSVVVTLDVEADVAPTRAE